MTRSILLMIVLKEEKMTDKDQSQAKADPRPEYEPPRAVRLSDMHKGTGGIIDCMVGSSPEGPCVNGAGDN